MSKIETDQSKNISRQKHVYKRICRIISSRAARISAAAVAAVVTKMDPGLEHKHTVAIDGSVYEKYPGFSRGMKLAMREMLGKKASRIKMALAKDGSGVGAAIIAAAADSLNGNRICI